MTQELLAHKDIIEVLMESRIPKKEININLWASVAATKLSIPQEAAYKKAKNAGRALQAAGVGRYVEGRRGRESRFRANVNMKEYVQTVFATAEEKSPKTKDLMNSTEAFAPAEMAALRRLLRAETAPTEKPALKDLLKNYSVEEVLAAAKDKLSENS